MGWLIIKNLGGGNGYNKGELRVVEGTECKVFSTAHQARQVDSSNLLANRIVKGISRLFYH